ncbi:MAG: ORF6N domain-containing protein [Candidatus Omnitrophota bacterium]|nr:ORF6N domain-containing protein [Candidatus Omnitrophota bacterium]MBU1928903.1 ORF6N domain-containing protein [Candidatus Omnitrophota bacterium]MBU2034513.1 ORF6N domain-containing protein [Candidatus Omnitrophota bacterium]MBU2258589.1 ORF6N domain-containing protein [Candidatus Omnitrophota bacterium]
MSNLIAAEAIATKILEIRGKRVMLDRDLAVLYGVKVKRLKEQVHRNIKRFPIDFMFELTWDEVQSLRSQFATLNAGQNISKRGKHIKYLPYVFTEQGVAMLSSVLNSERAIQVNIMIMRAFIKLREILLTHKDLAEKIEEIESKYAGHSEIINEILEAIIILLKRQRVPPPTPHKPTIGFTRD